MWGSPWVAASSRPLPPPAPGAPPWAAVWRSAPPVLPLHPLTAQSPNALFDSFQASLFNVITASLRYQNRIAIRGAKSLGSFLGMSLTLVPGRQQSSLWVESGRQLGPSVPLRRESPTTISLLSVLVEAVLRHVVDFLTLGILLATLSTSSSAPGPSSCRASNLLWKGTWEGGACMGWHRLRYRAGTCLHSSSTPTSPTYARQRQGRGSTPIWGVSPRYLSFRPRRELPTTLSPAHTP